MQIQILLSNCILFFCSISVFRIRRRDSLILLGIYCLTALADQLLFINMIPADYYLMLINLVFTLVYSIGVLKFKTDRLLLLMEMYLLLLCYKVCCTILLRNLFFAYPVIFSAIYLPLVFALYSGTSGILIRLSEKTEVFSILLLETLFGGIIFLGKYTSIDALSEERMDKFLYGYLFTLLLVLTYCLVSVLDKKRKQQYELQQKEELIHGIKAYNEQIEAIYQSTRAFRHDFANILVSMSGFFETQDWDGLHAYYQELLKENELLNNKKTDFIQLGNIDDAELKSLLAAKLMCANNLGLVVSVTIPYKVTITTIDHIDFIRITGIFLDNAIHAARNSYSKRLAFSLECADSNTIMTITNSCRDEKPTIPVSAFWNMTDSDHGNGIRNVQTILKRYDQVIWETSVSDYSFTQQLIF